MIKILKTKNIHIYIYIVKDDIYNGRHAEKSLFNSVEHLISFYVKYNEIKWWKNSDTCIEDRSNTLIV